MRNQCDHCGAKFGLVRHRWFGHRFHTLACKAAFLQAMTAHRAWLFRQG
jgi:hypothetical protein